MIFSASSLLFLVFVYFGGIVILLNSGRIEVIHFLYPVIIALLVWWKKQRFQAVYDLCVNGIAFLQKQSKWTFLFSLWAWTGFWSGLASVFRHQSFQSNGYDLGLFTNAFYHLVNFGEYWSAPRGGIDLFTDHQSFIVFLIAPVFKLFPSPETLLWVQSFGLASSIFPIFYICEYLWGKKNTLSYLVVLLFSINPVWRFANAFDFHPEVLMLPLFLFSLSFFLSRKLLVGMLFFLLSLLCKETAAFVGVGIAFLLVVGFKKTYRLSFLLFCLSVLMLVFDFIIWPDIIGMTNTYAEGGLNAYGGSLIDFIQSPWERPGVFWGNIFGPKRISYVFGLLAPVAFLAILSGWSLLSVLPSLLLLFLFGTDSRVSLQFHYGIEQLILIIPCALIGMDTIKQNYKQYISPTKVVLLVLIAVAFSDKSDFSRLRKNIPNQEQIQIANRLKQIPADSSVSANNSIVPHVSNRKWVSLITATVDNNERDVDYMVVLLNSSNWPRETITKENINNFVDLTKYELFDDYNDLKVFKIKNL